MGAVLRTPDERFRGLDGAGEPYYADVSYADAPVMRMAYLDVDPSGDATATTVVLLHGEPTWSYLYRKVIPVLSAAGLRVIAPDMIGFGRSDKPTDMAEHTYARHVGWIRALLVDHIGLSQATLVGQDWGGLIGLRLAAENPGLFTRIVAANTGLPTGDHGMPDTWWAFRQAVESAEVLDIGRLVAAGCARGLSRHARAAYDAPFPDESFKAGPRAMPGLVPVSPDDPATYANRAAWAVMAEWDDPFLIAFSDADPITGPMASVFSKVVPGTAGHEHPTIEQGGHFLQEDAGAELGEHIARFVQGTPAPPR